MKWKSFNYNNAQMFCPFITAIKLIFKVAIVELQKWKRFSLRIKMTKHLFANEEKIIFLLEFGLRTNKQMPCQNKLSLR